MAQRRMLSKRISQSKKVNGLPVKAQLIYTWIIPWLDDFGCYTGDSEDIKTEVFPKNRKITKKDIETALNLMARLGLIIWYRLESSGFQEKQDKLIQQYQNFNSFQTFKSDRERKSDYPPYEPENEGMVPIGNQRIPVDSLKLSKVNLIKEKEEYASAVFLTPEEYEKLVARFGKIDADERIAELSEGIGSKGYKYQSHYSTILAWARREAKKAVTSKDSPTSKLKCFCGKEATLVVSGQGYCTKKHRVEKLGW